MIRALFLFRRDLRLNDNTGLLFALCHAKEVIPAFVFTPEQIDNNPFRSNHCLKFMIESLEDLSESLKKKGSRLYLFQDETDKVVLKCIKELNIDAVVVNRDYTPYSLKRDQKLEKLCKKEGISFHSFDDLLLHPVEDVLKDDGTPYTVFTPYFRKASAQKVLPPQKNTKNNYFTGKIPFAEKEGLLKDLLKTCNVETPFKGGRKEALKILHQLNRYKNYTKERDFPAEDKTSHLSAYMKFTVCSPREVFAAIVDKLGHHHDLIRSLYWRDFFSSIAFFFPHVFEKAFRPVFDRIPWEASKKLFHRWCEGTTGFPLVDAGMRELNATGFMHNRVRMIAGSFLVKDLTIDWRWGEKYFATRLIDYDPCVNNGNWQWVAGSGCDAQPYFRIFNPWTQQKKFDPECSYIRKWVKELRDLPDEIIHEWHREEHHPFCPEYPPPLLDHSVASKKTLALYKKAVV
ncbi:MAG: hypothetical protein RLZZ453_246 [Chlamydiota bacterium]|jgi:deoxyribodipyrimidine photo-lyase